MGRNRVGVPVPDLEELLRETAGRVEPEVQRQLHGLFGGIVRSYLPQAWVFETDEGTASFLVDRAGVVSVAAGAAKNADVTVKIPANRLRVALTTRDPAKVPPGPLAVTPHTPKGKAAFGYLRGRLGL
jgi:hypothetical protein